MNLQPVTFCCKRMCLFLLIFFFCAPAAVPETASPVNGANTAELPAASTPEGPAYSERVQAVADLQTEIDALFGRLVGSFLEPVLFYSVGVKENAREVFSHQTAAVRTLWSVRQGNVSGELRPPEATGAPLTASFRLDTRRGSDGGDDSVERTGVIESPPFLVDSDRFSLLLAGCGDAQTYVALIDLRTGDELARLPRPGRDNMRPGADGYQLLSVDTSEHKGRRLVVRVVDESDSSYVALGGVYGARTGIPLIILVLVGGGIFFTVRYGFINIRMFRHAVSVVRGHYDDPRDKGEISHFQALASALAATVGLGNIAGVAVAITAGGPGAVFWMWVTAVFGMSLKFSSCTLAQVYRVFKEDGHVLGGPMVYLKMGMKDRVPRMAWLGAAFSPLFAVLTVFAAFGGGNMFQTNQTYNAINEVFGLQGHPAVAPAVGLLMAVLTGVVIIGGIKRIGEVTARMVPAMCLGYIVVCGIIVFANYTHVPGMLADIATQAFTGPAVFGGFLGVLIQGMKRAAFSNEAGLGSAAIAHAAAKTEEPVREGFVAMLGPFIDTIIVCTMTALAILSTGVHEEAEGMMGVTITARAFGATSSAFPYFLAVAVFIFAYSTLLGWSYYGERAIEYLFGSRGIGPYRTAYVLVAVLGPLLKLSNVVAFADMMLLSMAFPNIIGMLFLSGKVNEMKKDYVARLRSGQMKMLR